MNQSEMTFIRVIAGKYYKIMQNLCSEVKTLKDGLFFCKAGYDLFICNKFDFTLSKVGFMRKGSKFLFVDYMEEEFEEWLVVMGLPVVKEKDKYWISSENFIDISEGYELYEKAIVELKDEAFGKFKTQLVYLAKDPNFNVVEKDMGEIYLNKNVEKIEQTISNNQQNNFLEKQVVDFLTFFKNTFSNIKVLPESKDFFFKYNGDLYVSNSLDYCAIKVGCIREEELVEVFIKGSEFYEWAKHCDITIEKQYDKLYKADISKIFDLYFSCEIESKLFSLGQYQPFMSAVREYIKTVRTFKEEYPTVLENSNISYSNEDISEKVKNFVSLIKKSSKDIPTIELGIFFFRASGKLFICNRLNYNPSGVGVYEISPTGQYIVRVDHMHEYFSKWFRKLNCTYEQQDNIYTIPSDILENLEKVIDCYDASTKNLSEGEYNEFKKMLNSLEDGNVAEIGVLIEKFNYKGKEFQMFLRKEKILEFTVYFVTLNADSETIISDITKTYNFIKNHNLANQDHIIVFDASELSKDVISSLVLENKVESRMEFINILSDSFVVSLKD